MPHSHKSLFTSTRERRLWGWALLVLVAILATLGLANRLAAQLGQEAFSVALFITGCLLVLACVITQGLKTRPSTQEVGVALGIAAAYLLVFVRMAIPTERSHLVEYGVLAVLIHEALQERHAQGRHVPWPALVAIGLASAAGALDEGVQLFLPSRVFDPVDILFNTLAATMAVTASSALAWARRKAKSAGPGRASVP